MKERESAKAKKQKRDGDRANGAYFKATALLASLQTQQKNAVAFHSFTVAFCAARNQPLPAPLVLSPLPKAPVVTVQDNNEESDANLWSAEDGAIDEDQLEENADDGEDV